MGAIEVLRKEEIEEAMRFTKRQHLLRVVKKICILPD